MRVNETSKNFEDPIGSNGQSGLYYNLIQSNGVYMGTNNGSSMQSSLDKLLTDLRRKHAATAGSMINMMEFDMFPISGVVGLANENDIDVEEMVRKQDDFHSNHYYHRPNAHSRLSTPSSSRMNGLTSPESTNRYDNRKKLNSISLPSKGTGDGSGIASMLPYFNLSYQKSSFHKYMIGTAPHAVNLLHSTPDLQHMTSQSIDMGGPSSNRNLFSVLRQHISDHPINLNKSMHDHHSKSSNGTNSHNGHYSTHQNTLHEHYRQISRQLSSFVRLLANEMSLEEFAKVENQVFTTIFSLIHSNNSSDCFAGVIALNEMIGVEASAHEEQKAIKFANTLSKALRQSGDYAFLAAVTTALGRMATGAANVDFVESEATRALEWLRMDLPDKRLAACLTLKELAKNAPSLFYSKTNYSVTNSSSAATVTVSRSGSGSNEFIDFVFPSLRDPQPIVRACGADALSECIKILIQRQHQTITGTLCQIYKEMMDGFNIRPASTKSRRSRGGIGGSGSNSNLSGNLMNGINSNGDSNSNSNNTRSSSHNNMSAESDYARHGSLLIMREMVDHTNNFMLPRFNESCRAVLDLCDHPKPLIRLEIIRLIPHLARRCPGVFGRRFLDISLDFLLTSARTAPPPRASIDIRPSVFLSIGQLALAMKDEEPLGIIPTLLTKDHSESSVSLLSNGYISGQESSEPLSTSASYSSLPPDVLKSKKGIHAHLDEIFELVQMGLRSKMSTIGSNIKDVNFISEALHCGADLIEALGETAEKYVVDLVDGMFESGLSDDLIRSLSRIVSRIPSVEVSKIVIHFNCFHLTWMVLVYHINI